MTDKIFNVPFVNGMSHPNSDSLVATDISIILTKGYCLLLALDLLSESKQTKFSDVYLLTVCDIISVIFLNLFLFYFIGSY